MANITKYLEKRLLEQSVAIAPTVAWPTGGKSTNNAGSGTWAALFITSPDVDYTSTNVTGTEVTGTGYVRVRAYWDAGAVANSDLTNSSKIVNSNELRWPSSGNISSGWGTITTVGIFSSASAGELLWFGPLASPVTLNSGDSFTIAAGSLTLTLG